MEYWTFLVITLAAPFDGYVSTLPYPSQPTCQAAMEVVPATLPMEVAMVQCIESDTPSKSIRPQRRPEGLTND